MTLMTVSLAAIAMAASVFIGCPDKDKKKSAKETQVKLVQASGEKSGACSVAKTACSTEQTATLTLVAGEGPEGCGDKKASGCSADKTKTLTLVAGEGPEGCGDKKASGCSGDKTKTLTLVAGDQPCLKSVMSKELPGMRYVVGESKTSCSKTAKKMANEHGMTVSYEVAGSEYHCPSKAKQAHTEQLAKYLDGMTRVSFVVAGEKTGCPQHAAKMCSESGKKLQYRVGPAVFDSAEEAVKAAAMAYGAMHHVAMGYSVDGKATGCAKSADAMAEKKSCSVQYVVGEQKTGCSVTAKNMLTMAKIEAALAAIDASRQG